MSAGRFSDADVDAAIGALTLPGRLREAESRVAEMAPQLQVILAEALKDGGWFEAQESQVRQAATADADADRMTAIRTLLADEMRMSMLVGVAVGWELSRELGDGDAPAAPPDTTNEGA